MSTNFENYILNMECYIQTINWKKIISTNLWDGSRWKSPPIFVNISFSPIGISKFSICWWTNEPTDTTHTEKHYLSQCVLWLSKKIPRNFGLIIFRTEKYIQLFPFSVKKWTNWWTYKQKLEISFQPTHDMGQNENVYEFW